MDRQQPWQHPAPPGHSYPPQGYAVPGRPPKAKTSTAAWVALGGVLFLCASAAGLTAYALLRASTPEGKAELSAARQRDISAVDEAIDTLSKLSASLPAADAPALSCPAGTSAFLVPVTDSIYLDRLAGKPDAENAGAAAIRSLRTYHFDDKLVTAAENIRSGKTRDPHFAAREAKNIMETGPMVVIAVSELSAPVADRDGFTMGELHGQVVVFDRTTKKIVCHAPIHATSSNTVKTGGGVRLKVKGVPTPAIGSSGDLAESIKSDFSTNVKSEMKRALVSIGARE